MGGARAHAVAGLLKATRERDRQFRDMFRVSIHGTDDRLTLKLEGRLSGPWVAEAATGWQRALVECGRRPIEVDLCDAWGVDEQGEALLERMHRAGAELIVRGCEMRELVREIRDGARERDLEAGASRSTARRRTT